MHLGNFLSFNNNLFSLDALLRAQLTEPSQYERVGTPKESDSGGVSNACKFSIENLIKKD